MKTEHNHCCFCLSSSPEGTIVDSDILELLKFITADVNVSVLENSTVCDDCVNKIVATSNYKTKNSSKILMSTNIKEMKSTQSIMCQMCDKIFGEQEETFQLVDCVKQINWSDFVNYLFAEQDISVENSRLCDSCRVPVSNIQDFLKLLHVYDQSKMKRDIDNCGDSGAKDDEYLFNCKVEFKHEVEKVIKDDKIDITSNRYKDDGNIGYDDFKCKNEEVDLKMEGGNNDDYQYEKVDIKENGEHRNSYGEEKEQKLNSQRMYECDKYSYTTSDMLQHNLKHGATSNKMRDFKCTLCSKQFTVKVNLDHHLLKVHNCRDVTSKVYDCDKCGYATTKKTEILRHNITHEINDNVQNIDHNSTDNINKIYKCNKCNYRSKQKYEMSQHNLKHEIRDSSSIFTCPQCTYETSKKRNLIIHVKRHSNIRDFKCTLCSDEFTNKNNLNNHLLKIHNSRYMITNKVYDCHMCGYATTSKEEILRHKQTKHGINDNVQNFKCYHCTYETYYKKYLTRHMKKHNLIEINCTLCSRNFTQIKDLNEHLLKVHKTKKMVTSKIHKCDKCNFETTKKFYLLKHNLKHGVTVELEKHSCQHCDYGTYYKSNLIKHMKKHNIQDFNCTLCSKKFIIETDLNNHFLKMHNGKDVSKKKEQIPYDTRCEINNIQNFKCYHCHFATNYKIYLIRHVKKHNNRDIKCVLCSKEFLEKINLDNHLLKIHNCRDNITSKVYDCDKCNYATTKREEIVRHNVKHGINDNVQNLKCYHCTYETLYKRYLITHMKKHNGKFKCILCPKEFTRRIILNNHLVKIHNYKDVTSILYECDKCSYATTIKKQMMQHNLKH